MNNRWYTCFKAVIWKEFIEGLRSSKFIIPLTVLFVVGIQYLNVAQIVGNNHLSHEIKERLVAGISIYLPMMSIPFYGNTLLFRTIHEERLNRTVHVLLASGVPTTALWMGKFLVTSVLSYFISVFSIVGYGLFLKFYWGYSFIMTGSLWLMVLFIMPLLSIGVLAVISLSYWYLKNARMIGMVFPIITVLGVWNVSLKLGFSYPAPVVGFITLLIGIILVGSSFTVIKYISKERIVNV